ncbi:DNA internalization-related competence protein ComEC/Rec2 [[Clostridium] hylemonae]|uniref:DNA internalization-related competence protein ComEC/Rec2 n=1 Tax=[Clostridium] hylemonae TaxID=89153 RepID=UPI001D06C980|nr:DNA internalization-related competence protein ComEC/Rec2 [[Clostridium] hylemonae]
MLCSVCLLFSVVLTAAVCLGGDRFAKERKITPLMREARSGDSLSITGQVYAIEEKSEYQILYLKNNTVEFQRQMLEESKFIVYDTSKQKVKAGNKAAAEGKVKFFEEPRNPGNFNEKQYYEKQGIHACMWTDSIKVTDSRVWKVRDSLFSFRRKWKAVLYEFMGEKQGALLSGIMLGDKSDIDPEIKELYQINGIGHILAISGLHLTFIGFGLYRAVRRLSGSCTAGGICGMLFLAAYILMTGVSVSAVRAAVMFLFRAGAEMAGRHYDAPTALSAAAVTVLIWRPLHLYDGGFWLSFGAVFGAAVILPLFKKLPAQGLWASVSIQISIFPVLLYYFYEFPLYSLFLNLLVVPLMSVLLFLGLAGSAAGLIAELPGEAVFTVCRMILKLYEWICRTAAAFPAARIITGKPSLAGVVCYYILLAFVLLMWSRRGQRQKGVKREKYIAKYIIISGITWVLAFLILLLPARSGRGGMLEITMLDVGQGDGIYMKSPSGTTYFFDGGSSDVRQAGKYRIESFLAYKGTGALDYVFISHGDSDHMNGIREMIERGPLGISVRHLVLPWKEVWDDSLASLARLAGEKGTEVLIMKPGQSIRDGRLSLLCMHPGSRYGNEPGNAASMCIWARYAGFDMLFTGDVEGAGEAELTGFLRETKAEREKEGFDGVLEILKVAHHGSKNSTAEEFLTETDPVYGFISAGRNNRYGHPHEETVERLKEGGCRLFCTQTDGAVTVRTDGVQMYLSAFVSSADK